MSWDNIRQEINTNIAYNDHQLITAEKVRTTLLDIVGQTETVENEIWDEFDTVAQNLDDNYYTKPEVDAIEQTLVDGIGEANGRITDVENNLSENYYDKKNSDKLHKQTGMIIWPDLQDYSSTSLDCTVSRVDFIDDDTETEYECYKVEGCIQYGASGDLLVNVNKPYGTLYHSGSYTIRSLHNAAITAFIRALGTVHNPRIKWFSSCITATCNNSSNNYLMIGNVQCEDIYTGEFSFDVVSPYEQPNARVVINVNFRCWIQDVQQ